MHIIVYRERANIQPGAQFIDVAFEFVYRKSWIYVGWSPISEQTLTHGKMNITIWDWIQLGGPKSWNSSEFLILQPSVHLVNERTSAWLIHIPFFLGPWIPCLVKPPWSMLIRLFGFNFQFLWVKNRIFFLGEHLPGPIHPHPPVDLPCLGRGAFLRQAAQQRQRCAPGGAAELLGEVAWKLRNDGKIDGKNWWYPANDGKIHGKIYGLMWFMIHDGFLQILNHPIERKDVLSHGDLSGKAMRRFAWLAILNKRNGGILPSKQNISRFLLG